MVGRRRRVCRALLMLVVLMMVGIGGVHAARKKRRPSSGRVGAKSAVAGAGRGNGMGRADAAEHAGTGGGFDHQQGGTERRQMHTTSTKRRKKTNKKRKTKQKKAQPPLERVPVDMEAQELARMGFEAQRQGDKTRSIQLFRQALVADPGVPDAHAFLGVLLRDEGKHDEAQEHLEHAIEQNPDDAPSLVNLGNVYHDKRRYADAVDLYARAEKLMVGNLVPTKNKAVCLFHQGKLRESLKAYNKVLRRQRKDPELHFNVAQIHASLFNRSAAVDHYRKAIALKPNYYQAYNNLGNLYKEAREFRAAMDAYADAMQINPEAEDVYANLFHLQQFACEWHDLDARLQKLRRLTRKQMALPRAPALHPFSALGYNLSLAFNMELAQKTAYHSGPAILQRQGAVPATHPPGAALPKRIKSKKSKKKDRKKNKEKRRRAQLVVGYMSSNFGNHSMSYLLQGLFKRHDRAVVRVECFATSPSDNSSWRSEIEKNCDHFHDVSRTRSAEVAVQIQARGVHVLVDLNGHTRGGRLDVLARKPAPVQAFYLGYAGTMGAPDYMQYMFSDKIVTPPEYEKFYTEKFVYLPDTYFISDYRESHPEVAELPVPGLARSDYGLPAALGGKKAFVFCCFNQLYKIDPHTFDVWMRILKQVPHAVLWLPRFPAIGEENIRLEARARGIDDAARLVFTDILPYDEHIKVKSLCDMFLDTPIFNAHSTAVDILWAGVPLLTVPGEKMASRVAASLLHAHGLDAELVVRDRAAYERTAVALATSPRKYGALKKRVKDNRLHKPLFDPQSWVGHMERGLMMMAELQGLGEQPRHLIL